MAPNTFIITTREARLTRSGSFRGVLSLIDARFQTKTSDRYLVLSLGACRARYIDGYSSTVVAPSQGISPTPSLGDFLLVRTGDHFSPVPGQAPIQMEYEVVSVSLRNLENSVVAFGDGFSVVVSVTENTLPGNLGDL